jgi:segregation and condensation protein B
MARKLIATAGRKQVIGRPILYKTSKEFLLRFGLKDLNELPSIEEFEKMAGDLADSESDADSIQDESMPSAAEEPIQQADGSPADNPLDLEVEDALNDNPLRDDFDDIEPAKTAPEHEQE